jgi:hypothetical protein
MTGYYQLDGRLPKAFDDIEVLLTGHPENSIDALVLEGSNEKIRSLHFRSLLYIQEPRTVPSDEGGQENANRRSGHAIMESLADQGTVNDESLLREPGHSQFREFRSRAGPPLLFQILSEFPNRHLNRNRMFNAMSGLGRSRGHRSRLCANGRHSLKVSF